MNNIWFNMTALFYEKKYNRENQMSKKILTNSVKGFSSNERFDRINCWTKSGILSTNNPWKSSATSTCVIKFS